MSRKLYKLNEIGNHIDCCAQVSGKLTFAINGNTGRLVDVYGTELYSEKYGKKFLGLENYSMRQLNEKDV